jgi:hypothetical protein
MTDNELIDIVLTADIELTALSGAELLTGASSLYWGRALPTRRKKGTRQVFCHDLQSFDRALELEQAE